MLVVPHGRLRFSDRTQAARYDFQTDTKNHSGGASSFYAHRQDLPVPGTRVQAWARSVGGAPLPVRALLRLIDAAAPADRKGVFMGHIALISEHASPLAMPGGTDSGGQNVYVAHLARELARLDYRVDVFTRRDHPATPDIVDCRPGVRVIQVPAGPAQRLPKEALLPHMDAFARAMLGFIQQQPFRYALMHANFFMSGMVAQHIKQHTGVPYVITFHALGRVRRLAQGEADGFPDERFAIEAALMRDADCVIAECEQDETDMRLLYDGALERVAIVPCGVDPQEFWPVGEEARVRLGLAPEAFVVLQLGRMVPRKGVDTVLQALRQLRDVHGVSAQLLVVGGEADVPDPLQSPELQRLTRLAAVLGITDQVRFTGPQPRHRLREYYSASNVFVTTPWYEPFGITPLEAMACATPVVGSAVGGIRSTVLDGRTGFLVPPRDPHALAARLATLQADPALARRLGWTGLRRAHRHFTWERVAAQIARVYRTVCHSALPRVTAERAASGVSGWASFHA